MKTTRSLVSAWEQGDEAAGQQLFVRHYAIVERFLANKVGVEAPALVERIFVQLRQGQHGGASDDAVIVLRCARAVLLEYLGTRCAGEFDPSMHCVEEVAPPTLEPNASEETKELRDALRRLPVDEQILMELHLWESLKPHQLATLLEIPEAEVGASIRAAEQRVAEVMAQRRDANAADDPDPDRTLDADDGAFSTQAGSGPSARGAVASTAPGRRLGRYTLVRRLGAGGMGEVFEAHHVETGERVALKQLSKVDATRLYRFKQEFRALADVSHPNLIRLGELVVPSEGAAYFTMELLDGVPFVEYVRAGIATGAAPDSVRLGRALRQLVAGVMCMHEAGCIHRDLKPSNVLVTTEGRVVILDFGLVAASDDPSQGMTRDGQVLGTPAYMAPEQAGPDSKGEPVDYYALGVILYECLTGTLPFIGAPLQILVRKAQSESPDPAAVVGGIPAELRQLCLDLLERDPARRPTGSQVLARLSGDPMEIGPSTDRRAPVRVPFIGRVRELQMLDEALRDVRTRRKTVTVHVRGTSGLGKTALIGELTRRVKVEIDELTLLRGRCFERESVPYKGVDAVIDALAAWLRRLPEDDLERIRPRHLESLVRIFPVLEAVWTRELTEPSGHPPHELRRLGLVALREVMTRLAEGRMLVVHVDDFQWADEDGARLLGALVRPPDPPPLLLVVSFRDEVDEHDALRVFVSREERLGRDVRELSLEPLPHEDAEALARALVVGRGGGGIHSETARRVRVSVERAKGNPFYLGQLVRGEEPGSDEDLPLDRVVVQRIARLEGDARRVLAIVAAAGGPVAPAVVGRIFGNPGWETLVGVLEDLGLVTRRERIDSDPGESIEPGDSTTLETAHDRIREVVVGELDANELRALHLTLAEELERVGGEPELIAEHLLGGGERALALEHVERAADRAADALAFGRASILYRQALELLGADGSGKALARRQHLRLALARQLVSLGHCGEGGELLESLAEEASPTEALVLRAEAAEQLMHAGKVARGVALASSVLRAIGEPTPRSGWWTLLRLGWERLRIGLRGLGFEARMEAEIPRSQLVHFDILRTITIGMAVQQLIHSPILYTRLLYMGLELGEPRRLAVPLTYELTMSSFLGLRRRARMLEDTLASLVSNSGDLEIDQLRHYSLGLAHAAAGRFSDAVGRLGALCTRFAVEPGPHWLRYLTTSLYTGACLRTGRWRELEGQLAPWLVAARGRGNPNEISELEGGAALLHAYLGDDDRSRDHLAAARSYLSTEGRSMSHFILDMYEALILLRCGETRQSLAKSRVTRQRLRGLNVITSLALQREQRLLEGRISLVLALDAPADHRRRRTAQRYLRRQRRSRVEVYRVEAFIGLAALSSLQGDEDPTRELWRRAEALSIECRLDAHLAAIRWRLGHLEGEPEAAELRAFAQAHAQGQGWREPERIFDWLAPAHRR